MSEWRQLGYAYLRKGTHKIKIWKPAFRKAEPTEEAGETVENPDGLLVLSGFMLVPVVDISQLQQPPGREPPSVPACLELQGDAPSGLWDGISAQIRSRGYTIERADYGNAYGLSSRNEISYPPGDIIDPATCNDANFGGFVVPFRLLTIYPERRVIVRDGVEPAQAAKTLTHELAHILYDH